MNWIEQYFFDSIFLGAVGGRLRTLRDERGRNTDLSARNLSSSLVPFEIYLSWNLREYPYNIVAGILARIRRFGRWFSHALL